MKRMVKFNWVLVFLMLWSGVAFAQQKTVTGKVTASDDNMGLPGVAVAVKGTTTGTITDFDGNYSVSVDENATLVFSFIGFENQEVIVAGKSVFNIVLESSSIGLDEVVAIGYGSVKKSDLTGAVSTVSGDVLEEQPTARIEHALQGRSPGVIVQRSGGNVSSDDMKIRIRGTNSITGNNQPLVVIDGYLGGSLGDINPQDVKSMEVLSDASATAIYGSRGSNGVILVTTKKGKVGETKISYSGNIAWDKPGGKYDLLGAVDYMETVNAIGLEQNGVAWFEDAEIDEYRNGTRKGTDWQDAVFRTAFKQEHQVSISGGSEKSKFFNSIGFSDMEGVALRDDYKRITLRSNVENKITDFLTSSLNIGFTRKETTRGDHYKMGGATTFSPNLPIIDPETGDYQLSGNYGAATADNPVQTIMLRDIHGINNKFQANLGLDVNILKGLSYRFFMGTTINNVSSRSFQRYEPGDNPNTSEVGQGSNSSYSWQMNNQLNYLLESGVHNLNVTLVQEASQSEKLTGDYTNTNLMTNSLSYYNIQVGAAPTVSSGFIGSQLTSYLGRTNYTLKDKYLLSVSMRADGASKFAKGNKWAYYPSGAIAWQVHKEPFFSSVSDVMDIFKVRLSYGQVGSQAIDAYETKSRLLAKTVSLDGKTIANAAVFDSPVNPDLKWETTTQTNFGVNTSFFNRRLTFDFDYYYKKTTDLLYDVPQPLYTGIYRSAWNAPPKLLTNVGEMENQGITADLKGVVISSSDMFFEIGANFSYNTNKFLGFSGILAEQDRIALTQYGGSQLNGIDMSWLTPGESLGEMYGLQYIGTWKQSQAAEAAEFGHEPGDARFVDVNGDKKYDNEDASKIGSGMPKYNVGLTMNFSYKAWDVSALFQGALGFDLLNLDKLNTRLKYTSKDVLNRYTPDNESDIWIDSKFRTTASDEFIEKGDYLRLNNLSVGYTLSEKVLERVGLSKCRVYMNAQNLFTITGFSGLDPSVTSTGTSDLQQGIVNGAYAIPRTISFGVNLTL